MRAAAVKSAAQTIPNTSSSAAPEAEASAPPWLPVALLLLRLCWWFALPLACCELLLLVLLALTGMLAVLPLAILARLLASIGPRSALAALENACMAASRASAARSAPQ